MVAESLNARQHANFLKLSLRSDKLRLLLPSDQRRVLRLLRWRLLTSQNFSYRYRTFLLLEAAARQ